MARRQHLTLTLMAVMVFLGLTYIMSTGAPHSEYRPAPARVVGDDVYTQKSYGSTSSGSSVGSSSSNSESSSGSSSGSSTGHTDDHSTEHSEHSEHGEHGDHTTEQNPASGISEAILKGGSIAPKLENATAKAELGRASWKLLHTMMARFPEEPTEEDSLTLKTYIQLFARLYPCGDCASHFQKMIARYPPQTGSRNAAAGWACFVHNQVNKRLHKPEFDCNKIGDFYDCGCGEEGGEKKKGGAEAGKEGKAATTAETAGGKKGDELKGREGVTLEKEEGLTRGG